MCSGPSTTSNYTSRQNGWGWVLNLMFQSTLELGRILSVFVANRPDDLYFSRG